MQIASDSVHSALKLTTVVVVAMFVTGCISAKSKPTEESTPAEPAVVEVVAPVVPAPEPELAPEPEPEPEPEALTSWTVVEGENLWGIAAEEEVYNVPEQWPLIYKANLDQITDADLIYPGQILDIPRDSSQSDVDAAVNHARTRGAWSVGPVEASDQEYLKN